MKLTVDVDHQGTSARAWSASRLLASTPAVDPETPERVVVIAPHPDDEVLGAGGLIQELVHRGAEPLVVAVTDGEASHPGSALAKRIDLRSIRAKESVIALGRLGIPRTRVVRLRIPDGQVTRNIERLEAELVGLLEPGDLCVAPWERDGHPDHDASGAAARNVASVAGSEVLNYLVWALHWADPEGDDLPWQACRRYELTVDQRARKHFATLAFRSQIRRLGRSTAEAPVLPLGVLQRHWLGHELFIDPRAVSLRHAEAQGNRPDRNLGIEAHKEPA